jgi:hypothetical protein
MRCCYRAAVTLAESLCRAPRECLGHTIIFNEHHLRQRRETVEHPFGTIKARMGATHFLMKTLPRVATEMALHVLTYTLTRDMNIMGPGRLIAAMRT